MSVRSFLLSALRKKFAGVALDRFTEAHPHDWVVWEPGAWLPPSKMTISGPVPTGPPPKPTSSNAEALAIALEPKRDGKPVVIGREGADFNVNDATVSKAHLAFTYDGFRWTVQDLGSRNGSTLDGLQLRNKPEPVFNGVQLEIGSARLTYYLPAGMHARLKPPTR